MNTAIAHHSDPPSTDGFDDPFHDPVVIGMGIAFVIVGVVILALTGLFTWGTCTVRRRAVPTRFHPRSFTRRPPH